MTTEDVAVLTMRVAAIVLCVAAATILPLVVFATLTLLGDSWFWNGTNAVLSTVLAALLLLSAQFGVAWAFWKRPAWFVTVSAPQNAGGDDRRIAPLLSASFAIYGGILLLGPVREAFAQWLLLPQQALFYSPDSDVVQSLRKLELVRDIILALALLLMSRPLVRLLQWIKTPRTSSSSFSD